MAIYAEDAFKVDKYEFNVIVGDGLHPERIYVWIRDYEYNNSASFLKCDIENKSMAELKPGIQAEARSLAAAAHSTLYTDTIQNCAEFEKTFAESLEPILAEGINNFNGGKSDSRAQEIIIEGFE